MDDFKIGDEIEDKSLRTAEDIKKEKKKKTFTIIGMSVLFGVIVFVITYVLFGPKEVEPIPVEREKLELSEQNVQILYQYITYGRDHKRTNKFLSEISVTQDSFTENEKYYYALYFMQPTDLTKATPNNTTVSSKNDSTYFLSEDKLNSYMKRYFGDNVEYSKNSVINTRFNVIEDDKNVGTLTYNNVYSGYEIVFESLEGNNTTDLIKPYYYKLSDAYKEIDGSYTLEEKVVYTQHVEKEDETFDINICKDINCNEVIAQRPHNTKEMLTQNPLNIGLFIKEAATIRYTFKMNESDNSLYFYSSEYIADTN